jgi:hypothetical protein
MKIYQQLSFAGNSCKKLFVRVQGVHQKFADASKISVPFQDSNFTLRNSL